jgi:PAS domain S-box-containing protein
MGFLLGYFSVLDLLKNAVGSDYRKIADALAFNVQQGINEEASCIKGLMMDLKFKKALKESNSRYQEMLPADIQRFMTDMDRQWIKADKNSPLVKEYLETDISQELRDKSKARPEIAEVFISDKYGGLVAASGKATDFYQADESWWEDAFTGGGEIFIGDIESDGFGKTPGMVFVLPIKDDNGQVIGIAKAAVDIQRLFNFLEDFKFGHTGHVVLVDEKGYVISHKGIKPLSRKFLSDINFQKIIQSKTRIMIIGSQGVQANRILSAFAEVRSSLLLKKGIVWRVFVEQDARDVLWPLYRLTLQAVGVIVFLIILIPILGFILGSKISRPIEKLKEASDHITKGELDYPVRIKTGDELEELANSFRVMALSIKERESQLINQKAYLEGIITSIVDVLIVINLDATLKSVNKAALDLLGYKENELIGQPVNKILLPGKGGEVFSKYFENIINAGAAYNISLTFIFKEGKKIPVDFSGAAMREKEKIMGIVVVAKDMRQIMEVISN